jgi:hypothetical protein
MCGLHRLLFHRDGRPVTQRDEEVHRRHHLDAQIPSICACMNKCHQNCSVGDVMPSETEGVLEFGCQA